MEPYGGVDRVKITKTNTHQSINTLINKPIPSQGRESFNALRRQFGRSANIKTRLWKRTWAWRVGGRGPAGGWGPGMGGCS